MQDQDLLILRYFSQYHVCWWPRGWINIKMSSNQYRKSHCGDKTILRPSYLHNGISYTDKTTFLYWIRALMTQGAGTAMVFTLLCHNILALASKELRLGECRAERTDLTLISLRPHESIPVYGSRHENAAVFLPGFATSWSVNWVVIISTGNGLVPKPLPKPLLTYD